MYFAGSKKSRRKREGKVRDRKSIRKKMKKEEDNKKKEEEEEEKKLSLLRFWSRQVTRVTKSQLKSGSFWKSSGRERGRMQE